MTQELPEQLLLHLNDLKAQLHSPLTSRVSLRDIFLLAKFAHVEDNGDDVVDHGGYPYIHHPIRVLLRLPTGASDNLKFAALLHDVIEDTKITAEDLLDCGVPSRAVELVIGVSKMPDDPRTYINWIRDICSSGDLELITLKIADTYDNAAPARIAQLPEKLKTLPNRYYRSLKILTATLPTELLDQIRSGDIDIPKLELFNTLPQKTLKSR